MIHQVVYASIDAEAIAKIIEHNNTRELRGSASRPTSTEETLDGYINNILECSTNPLLQ